MDAIRKLRVGLIAALLVFCIPLWASDHADPVFNKDPEESLSGLFVFPHKDRMIVILNFFPGLKEKAPSLHHVKDLSFQVHFDLTTGVSFNDVPQKLRYGGTIDRPGRIAPTATIEYRLNESAELIAFEKTGVLRDVDIKTYVGVRDDPFIFPKFFGSNVVALVASIPMDAFGPEQKDFIVWGGIYKKGKKVDHVGRSNRTMQPRLDFLNTLEPSEHLQAIIHHQQNPGLVEGILMSKLAPLFAIRDYDKFADVMIYSTRFDPGFPNGRMLADDVAAITCQTGDCLLWELSFADVKNWQWPRQTSNDKAFMDHFPFLADPW